MFISRFNRYFEKHSKITYLVLLIVIIATFVIFVTPGNVFRGGQGKTVTDLGEMYGKTLDVDTMAVEMKKTMVAIWLQYPQFFGRDLGLNNDTLFQETLLRLRFLHAAKAMGVDKVSDDEVRKAIGNNPAFQENGGFSPEVFNTALEVVKRQGLQASDFDQVVREGIIIERLKDKVTSGVSISEEEINAVLAQYSLKCATIPVDSKAAEPTEEEIRNFFETRQNEIQLPETKNVLVAVFAYDALKEKAASDASFAEMVNPTAEEIQNYFNTNGERLYAGKTLEEVSAEIKNLLLDEKIRSKARQLAAELAAEFKEPVKDESEEVRRTRFQRDAAVKFGGVVTPSVVSTENTISGLGSQPGLADAIRRVPNTGEVTDSVVSATFTAVAYVTEKGTTPMPSEVTDYLRASIRQKLLREKALAFFQNEVKKPYDEYMEKITAINNDTSLDTATRQQQIYALESTLDAQLILKFLEVQTRDFVQVAFAPSAYLDQVPEPTEEALREAYAARADVYGQVKVRLGRIFVATAGLEGEALTAKEAKLAEIQQALKQDGADFLAIAKKYTEASSVEDSSLRNLDQLSEAIRAKVANSQAGQLVEEVIQDATGSYIVKVLARQEARSFDEVQAELKEALIGEAARKLAEADAAKFAAELSDQWWAAMEKEPEQAPTVALLFEEAVKSYPVAKLESFTNVNPNDGTIPREIMVKVFTVTEKAPVSSNIVTKQGSYVVGLTGVTEAHLADPEADPRVYITLLAAYRDAVQMEMALRSAQSERARLSEALVGDADIATVSPPLKFEDLPAFSKNDINSRSTVVSTIENGKLISIDDLAAQLANAKPGMVLEPIRAERRFPSQQLGGNPYQVTVVPVGYQLIYVAGVDMEAGKTVDAETREALREQMQAMKENQVLNDFMVQLEAESNTRLRVSR